MDDPDHPGQMISLGAMRQRQPVKYPAMDTLVLRFASMQPIPYRLSIAAVQRGVSLVLVSAGKYIHGFSQEVHLGGAIACRFQCLGGLVSRQCDPHGQALFRCPP